MAKEKRPYWLADDDDGRTIADMSGVRRRNILIPHPFPDGEEAAAPDDPEPSAAGQAEAPVRTKNRVVEQDGRIMDEAEAVGFRPWEERSADKEETRGAILGALGAGMLLVGIFIVAGGLLIALMLWAWT